MYARAPYVGWCPRPAAQPCFDRASRKCPTAGPSRTAAPPVKELARADQSSSESVADAHLHKRSTALSGLLHCLRERSSPPARTRHCRTSSIASVSQVPVWTPASGRKHKRRRVTFAVSDRWRSAPELLG